LAEFLAALLPALLAVFCAVVVLEAALGVVLRVVFRGARLRAAAWARGAFSPGESAAEESLPVSLRLMVPILPDGRAS
jgi:hypothetical protein